MQCEGFAAQTNCVINFAHLFLTRPALNVKYIYFDATMLLSLSLYRKRISHDKDRLSMVDKDGESLQDMQLYSPPPWSKESGLHSLGGKMTES